MDQMTWTTRWEIWRKVMGAPSSRQRRHVMEFLQRRPALLYWGDSWFSTPLYLNLARQSLLRMDGMAMVVGKPGATASELFGAGHVANMAGRIQAWPFDVLCLSAGGNDQLSERLAKVFAAWMPPARKPKIDARQAFDVLLGTPSFDVIRARYAAVLDAVRSVRRKRPALRVVAHGYAPLQRIGAKADLTVANIGLIAWIKDDVGPWLWRPMQHVLPDLAEGKRFANLLLTQGFRDRVLKPLAQPDAYGDFFSYADLGSVPGVSNAAFWNDEIHPTEAGFADLAVALNAQVRSVLPAAKQVAVR
ncbi:MAG: hypothetical protein ACREPE_03080 [Lysobacter sp.]